MIVAVLLRISKGLAPVAPDPSLSTAADLLRMWHGKPMDPTMVAALDTYFTVMAESGLPMRVHFHRPHRRFDARLVN